jgi:germination protein M
VLRDDSICAVGRSVPHTQAVARAALEQLLAGPTDAERAAGLTTALPADGHVVDVAIANGTATVDLSGALDDAARAQVTYTLTQFPTIARVVLRVDGQPAPPVTRADYEELTPPLLVESPLPGARVTSPLRIRGTANAFEATFQADLVAADGRLLAHKTVMATSGSGERGTFDETLTFARGGAGKLVVYENSAADGSRIHQVEVPLELRP